MIQLSTLDINRVMIHQIPKLNRKDKETKPLEVSDLPIKLDPKLKTFFRDRILKSMDKWFGAIYRAPEDPDDGEELVVSAFVPSAVPSHVVSYFATNMDSLVETSQDIARELYRFQTGSASEGLLVVIDARIMSGPDSGAVLAVLKLENDEALLVKPTTRNGKSTFSAQLQQVTLPKQAQVFKAAIFPRAAALADVRAQVSDNQRDANVYGDVVANFFLQFLGCRLRDSPDRATRGFLEAAELFAKSLTDDADKIRVINAALAEIESNKTIIDPKQFANNVLKPRQRDAFLQPLRLDDGSVPTITKDTTLLGDRLKGMVLEFDGGVRVSGPRDAVSAIRQTPEGWLIETQLKRASHSGRR